MHYFEYNDGPIRIEFYNSFSGKETVRVNGQVVSSKSSVMGTDHHFDVVKDGKAAHYCLLTKIGGPTMVLLDLICNQEYILRNQVVPHGSGSSMQDSSYLKDGLKALRAFDLEKAEQLFVKGIYTDPRNPLLFYHLACVHSLNENKQDAFKYLVLALENGLVDRQRIATEDGLAYIRIEEEFEAFCIQYKIDYP